MMNTTTQGMTRLALIVGLLMASTTYAETQININDTPPADLGTKADQFLNAKTPESQPNTPAGTSANSPTAYTATTNPVTPANTSVATTTAAQTPINSTSPDPTGTGTASVTSPVAPNTTAVITPAAPTKPAEPATPSMVAPANAADALRQKDTDASKEKNLDQVFKATEKTYSLSKKGSFSAIYDLDYTYYRDTQIDLALSSDSSVITRLQLGEVSQHTVTNTITGQYGFLDNLTLTGSIPFIARTDPNTSRSTAGLGDISLGARWEPFAIERGKMPLILFGTFSSKTGDSPYTGNPVLDLSTGKGYYSIGGGASTRKFIDPIVLFGSVSANYGFNVKDLNQVRGSRILTEFQPGFNGGLSFGFAYSLNYDVSLTMSYQQSFALGSQYSFIENTGAHTYSKTADQSSASLNIAMGVRISPKTIINGSVGFGLTPDAPDVSLGLSFPLDFESFKLPLRGFLNR